jgi:hypothetical protein
MIIPFAETPKHLTTAYSIEQRPLGPKQLSPVWLLQPGQQQPVFAGIGH